MFRVRRWLPSILLVTLFAAPAAPGFAAKHAQDTGFLDRVIMVNGIPRRYVVYLPANWNKDEKWPMILFLHGSGERGSEGLDESQVGLPAAIRMHPERWPFVVVMPQVPYSHHHWTDPDMMQMALDALRTEVREFHGDPDRMYLTGLSLGGYGTWELARDYPHMFAAIAPVAGGVFWSYQPSRWNQEATLPGEYARALRHEPVWMFHGMDDPVVSAKQSELMYTALKEAGGNVRLSLFVKVKHNVWDKAYGDPDLPHWLLSQSLRSDATLAPASERVVIPVHPVPAHVDPDLYNAYIGSYDDNGVFVIAVFRDGDRLFQRNRSGEVEELLPENANTFFFPSGGPGRLVFEREAGENEARSVLFRDDRHEERWQRHP